MVRKAVEVTAAHITGYFSHEKNTNMRPNEESLGDSVSLTLTLPFQQTSSCPFPLCSTPTQSKSRYSHFLMVPKASDERKHLFGSQSRLQALVVMRSQQQDLGEAGDFTCTVEGGDELMSEC